MSDYKTLSSEQILSTPYFGVDKDRFIRHDGQEKDFWVIRKQPAVFIIAVNTEQKIYLVKQFRYPTKQWSWELPAGGTDGEEPLVAAQRELWEETGLHAARWLSMGTYQVGPGLSDNIGHIWMAKILTDTDKNEQAEEGIIECKDFTIPEIKQKILTGEISDGPTLAVFCKVFWGVGQCIHNI